MVIVIDNYDSFVYNLARYVELLGHKTLVCRSNRLSINDITLLNPTAIVISPGPCTPNEAGISLTVVKELGHKIPILGVCLGHQVIGQAFGGTIKKAQRPMHGKASPIWHQETGMFEGLENPLTVGRYHSLIVEKETLPAALRVTSYSEEGEIMSLEHREYPVYGLQFHPESLLTVQGERLIQNFLRFRLHVASTGSAISPTFLLT